MNDIIGICGLNCSTCPGYIATQNDDDVQRKIVAEEWSKAFSKSITMEDINCDGCTSQTGRLFSHCHVCEIRKCGLEKNVKNCAFCEEFPCEKINEFFNYVPEAKVTLERIKESL